MYRTAVRSLQLAPREFWGMTPAELMVLMAELNPRDRSGLTNEDRERLLALGQENENPPHG